MSTKSQNLRRFTSHRATETKIIRADGYRCVYANNVKITYGPFDARITFGNYTDDVGPNKFLNVEETTVVMSHVHLKLFAGQCASTVKQLESIVGTIAIPASVVLPQTDDSSAK